MVAILQPYVPHYRKKFFEGIEQSFPTKIYCYENDEISKSNFQEAGVEVIPISGFNIGPFVVFDIRPFIQKDNQVVVLMLTFLHISTWILLLTKFLHKKKIILWGHGISVKRYANEVSKPSILLKMMIFLADKTWFYTKSEEELWRRKLANLDAVSLSNTISNIDEIFNAPSIDKNIEKKKLKINQPTIFIFCARFNQESRRTDLLVQAIQKLDPKRFGFIIIGDGKLKPDFKIYDNIYDFGAVYDDKLKSILFQISDIYFQPGWVGLSLVEAMAYGKPIFTFKRSNEVLQCVEYSYIEHDFNGMLFSDIDNFITTVNEISEDHIFRLSRNAQEYTRKNLSMTNMIAAATQSIDALCLA